MNWFRFYTNSLNKPKVQKLPPELFKAWVNLLCVASVHGGTFPSSADIAFELRCSEGSVDDWMGSLIAHRLIDETTQGLRPHDWEEHQYPSDSSTERSRKFRQRQRKQQGNVAATANEATLQRARTEQSRTEQNRNGIASPTESHFEESESWTATPSQNPALPSKMEATCELLMLFPGAKLLPGMPDEKIQAMCLLLAGDDVERLGTALRAIHLTGKKPEISWALKQYLEPKIMPRRTATA